MDRNVFDREREAIQEELAAQGQNVVVPDPDSAEYLGFFMTLQRTNPALARRLATAEQADPAELLDPYVPRAPKVTARHRLNTFFDRNFNRRGLDGQRVLDRQKAFRAGLFTVGGLLIGGLVYSVVAPKPAQKADQYTADQNSAADKATADKSKTASTKTNSSGTDGAFVDDGTNAAGSAKTSVRPSVSAGMVKPPKDENVFSPTNPDSQPKPVTATAPDSATSSNTPPPPAVFNQVTPDPYTPVANAPASSTAPEAAPSPASSATPSYADSSPSAAAPAPSPFGGSTDTASTTDTPPTPVNASSNPVASTEVGSPFGDAPETAPAPATAKKARASGAAQATAAVPAPFGSNSATASPTATSNSDNGADQSVTRGVALIYQRPQEAQAASSTPKSALLYQAPREEAQSAAARSVSGSVDNAAVYRQVSDAMDTNSSGRGSLIYQRSAQVTAAADTAAQNQTTSIGNVTSTATSDPEAPQFAPTSVISGKLFSNVRTAAGLSVPAIVMSKEGNWIGMATYNTALGRVDIHFDSFVQYKNSKSYPVQAAAFQFIKGQMSEGVIANIHPIAPTLPMDLARAGLNSLNTYAEDVQNAGTVTSNGSLITTSRSTPELAQVVRGEVGKVFALPENNQSIKIVADVGSGADIQVIYGVVNTSSDDSLNSLGNGN